MYHPEIPTSEDPGKLPQENRMKTLSK